MKFSSLVTLLSLYYLLGFSSATRCLYLADGSYCCGLAIGIFQVAITETFAQTNGFFAEEGLNVCYYKTVSSVFLYDTLLANQTVDFVGSNTDNAMWRYLNFGTQLSVVGGTDGARGFFLLGNTKTLNGWDSVAALQGQNILVDSADSGFVVGLKKVLADFGVTNYTFVPYGANRLTAVQQGNLNGVPIAATMQNAIAPYLVSYPVVNLAAQYEHFCPTQGTGYVAPTAWLANSTNYNDMVKYFRALIKSYNWLLDPKNRPAINAFISTSIASNDTGLIELVYNDYFINPATGLNPYITPRKEGLRNLINTRILYGMSPSPAGGVENMVTDQPGGFVDLGPLKEAQNSLNVYNSYDTDNGLAGCPIDNKGTITPDAPTFTCSVSYSISTQPPNWPTGMTANIDVSVSNASALIVNGAPGWSLQFTAKGNAGTAPFQITSSWNTGTVTSVASGSSTAYTLTNANYNQQAISGVGFNAATTLPAPYNNICGVKVNNIPCTVATPSTASASC